MIITVDHLRKTYGALEAVADISFQVAAGEIFGVVGPNGAGKTTLIECLEGLRKPSGGVVRVLDLDPATSGPALKQKLGIQLQQAALPDRIKVWEALDLYASFYDHPLKPNLLLGQLGLKNHQKMVFAKLSGGQKQRLFIALALINDPELLFLDELTTGLDPQARRAVWDMVHDIQRQGKTIFLTTHSMEEAQNLCDRVAIIDQGRLVALDTPANLVKSIAAEHCIALRVKTPFPGEKLQQLPGFQRIEAHGENLLVYGRGDRFSADVVTALSEFHLEFSELRVTTPNLEDVFLRLTGREMRD